jgi:hypothetical protein
MLLVVFEVYARESLMRILSMQEARSFKGIIAPTRDT